MVLIFACAGQPTVSDTIGASTTTPPPTVSPEVVVQTLQSDSKNISISTPSTSTESRSEATLYPCSDQVCTFSGHFVFRSPIAAPGTQAYEPSYPYGGTQDGTREAHHGVEFINAPGTPVLAAGDGVVVVAGNDVNTLYGLMLFYYGNLVVIQHEIPGQSKPVFTLYAHLSRVDVQPGQKVIAGQQIGLVGRSGKAIGSHLHFEVRVGENDYAYTRNPLLWLSTDPGYGILTGQIFDQAGRVRRYPEITIRSLDDLTMVPIHPRPYAESNVNGDDLYQEIFTSHPLPAGKYRLTFSPPKMDETIDFEIYANAVTRITLITDY